MIFLKPIRALLPDRNWQHPDPQLQKGWDYLIWSMLVFPLLGGVGAILLLIGFISIWRNKYPQIKDTNINRSLGLLALLMLLVTCWAKYPFDASVGLVNFLPFFGLFAAYSVAIQSSEQLRKLAWIFIFASIPVIIIGLVQMGLGFNGGLGIKNLSLIILEISPMGNPEGRMSSIFMHANTLGIYLQMMFILGLGLWLDTWEKRPTSRLRLFSLSLFITIAGFCIYATSSRAAWGGTILSIFSFVIYKRYYSILTAIGAVIAIVFGSAYAPTGIKEPLRLIIPRVIWARITDEMYPDRPKAITRMAQWQFALNMIRERPLTGWGLQSFSTLYQEYTHIWLGSPHNLFLMLGSSLGLPVVIFFMTIIGSILYNAILTIDKLGEDRTLFFTYLLVFGGFIIFNITDISVTDLRLNSLAWIVLACICGVSNRN